MVPGLSPYGFHISGVQERWSCDCIDPYSGPYRCFGSNEPCSCYYLPCTLLTSMLHEEPSTMKCTWSGNFTSTGKECLIQDVDEEWLELEAELNHLIDDNARDMTANTTIVDNDGYRDINAAAIQLELKLFSGVIRLKTMMEIFKIDSFSRRLDFFDCLRCCCSMANDHIFGTMIVFKGHFYIPARKMKEIQQERNRQFRTNVEVIPTTQHVSSKRIRRGKKRSRTRSGPSERHSHSRIVMLKNSNQVENVASQHDLVATDGQQFETIHLAETLVDEPQPPKESSKNDSLLPFTRKAAIPTHETSSKVGVSQCLNSSDNVMTVVTPPAAIPTTYSPNQSVTPQTSRLETISSSNTWAKIASTSAIYPKQKNQVPSILSKSEQRDSSQLTGKAINATSFPPMIPKAAVLINSRTVPTPIAPPGFETTSRSNVWSKVASTPVVVPIPRGSCPRLPSKITFPDPLQSTYKGINKARSETDVPETGRQFSLGAESSKPPSRWVEVASRRPKIFQRFELSKLDRVSLQSKLKIGESPKCKSTKEADPNKSQSVWSPSMDRSGMLWRGKTMVV